MTTEGCSENVTIPLKDGDAFREHEFVRATFKGSARHVSFDHCAFVDSLFESPLIDSVVANCTFANTHLPITRASLVDHNVFDGYSEIRDMPPDLTVQEQRSLKLRKIPILGWILHRLGMLTYPCGSVIVGNFLAAREES